MAKKKIWHKLGGIWKNVYNNDDGTTVTKLKLSLELAEPAVLKVRKGDKVVDVELIPDAKGRVNLQLQNPADEINSLLANGYIDEDKAKQRIDSLPEALRFNVVLPPPRD